MHVVFVGPQDAARRNLQPGWYIATNAGQLLAGPFASELAARQRLAPEPGHDQGR